MPTFKYRAIDAVKWVPGGLRPMRLGIGTLCASWTLLFFHALQWIAGLESPWVAIGGQIVLAVLWWIGFAWLKLWLMRAAVLRICANKNQCIVPSTRFAIHHAMRLALTPVVAALPAMLLCVPLAVLAALISIPLSVSGVVDSGWALFLAITLAPLALTWALWVLTLPLTFAATALHGGDAWEAWNRGIVWGMRGMFVYAPLSLVEHAAVFALLWYVVPTLFDASYALGVLALGALFAAWTTMDVAVALLVRHKVEGTPVSVYFDPVTKAMRLISEQERVLAKSEMT